MGENPNTDVPAELRPYVSIVFHFSYSRQIYPYSIVQGRRLGFPDHSCLSHSQPLPQEGFGVDLSIRRIRVILSHSKRYFELSNKEFHRSSLIAVPIATYFLAYNALPEDEPKDDKKDDHDDDHHFFHFHKPSFDRYWKARLIAFAVWIALMILVFVPMRMWKKKVSVTLCLVFFWISDLRYHLYRERRL